MLHKIESERTFPDLFCEASITLIPKPDKDIARRKLQGLGIQVSGRVFA
jgi:hypothetical protein